MCPQLTGNCDWFSTYILLTKREGRTGKISARGLDNKDRAQQGPYKKRPRADILPVRSRASLVNKRFITRLKKAKTQVRDHSGQCPVRYLENIGPAIEHFDWLILVIGPLTA